MKPQLIFLLFSITAFNIVAPIEGTSGWEWLTEEIKSFGDSAVSDLISDASISDTELEECVKFCVYNLANPENGKNVSINDDDALSASGFNVSLPTRIIIHGFDNTYISPVANETRDAFLAVGDFNIVVVDWSPYSTQNYVVARTKSKAVGEYVGLMINYLVDMGMDIDDLIVMGHSMGAHIAGVASRNANSTVPYVIGCDPAGPLYVADNAWPARLNKTDATFVEVIHTNAGTLGYDINLGDLDFWPNGGQEQPGCTTDDYGACSHGRSWEYYAESVKSTSEKFVAYACDSYALYEDGSCSSADTSYLGGLTLDSAASGTYYLTTNNASLYCQD